MDWGTGEYERTAREIEPAARTAIDALHPRKGQSILDVACGTGNAALLAAAQGARTTGVDGSGRLLEVAAQRARIEAVEVDWSVADVGELPYPEDSFDGVISVFGVIFADDSKKAASELLRVAKPGGTVVITAWIPTGPIADMMKHVGTTIAEVAPPDEEIGAHFNWSDADNLRELFGPDIEITEHELAFKSSSPGAWILQQAEYHPAWRDVREALPPDRFERLLDELTQMMTAVNTSDAEFSVASGYVIARTRIPG